MSLKNHPSLLLLCVYMSVLMIFAACEQKNELPEWASKHGFGPIDETVELGELDPELAAEGHELFISYCEDCHSMDGQVTGPALRPGFNRRSPEYIMNYILNPIENREKHPAGRELSEQYTARMLDLAMTREEARAIYEYMRYYNEKERNPPYE